ncbi:S41 family peptidase [Sandaracinobacteroides hominis]|uniref:S41 family peptidase n=1 Tax=Sandaracinobacteroides hominis TaxID=2780086 RepID=UPI001F25CBBD|nr:S41 family peptidase [Sandaracinobacteroides hominis]
MSSTRLFLSVALSAVLVACTSGDPPGGELAAGEINAAPILVPGSVTPAPSPTPGTITPGTIGGPSTPGQPGSGCTLRERQDWAAAQIREWYLFPETLPAGLDPANYQTVQGYIDALTANARAQGRDRYFTHLASIAEEDAYYESGSTAAFGMRVQQLIGTDRQFIGDVYENTAASRAGLVRGDEIVAIGTTPSTMETVTAITAQDGAYGVTIAMGPPDVGVSRTLQLRGVGGSRTVTLTKTEFDIQPVSPNYGVRIIEEGGQKTGYLNLRTFISTADPQLRQAFRQFKAAGVQQLIIDFRYNGGGMVDIAELMGDLMGEARLSSDVFEQMRFRPEKSSNDSVKRFERKPESIAPLKLAFITSGDSASASEAVINGMLPWARDNVARQCDDGGRQHLWKAGGADRAGSFGL